MYLPKGEAEETGSLFSNPDLAKALKKVTEGGRDVFYKGETAQAINENVGFVGGHDRGERRGGVPPSGSSRFPLITAGGHRL